MTARKDETKFRVDDRVMDNGCVGTIVADIFAGVYSPTLRIGSWHSLTTWVLVRWDDGTITHLRESQVTLRALPPSGKPQ
jgi:hypothetical protein